MNKTEAPKMSIDTMVSNAHGAVTMMSEFICNVRVELIELNKKVVELTKENETLREQIEKGAKK